MYRDIDARVIKEAEYVIRENATVRRVASVFGVSKSTVHHDVTIKLRYVDERLFKRVKRILNANLSERHIRGGMATRSKYLKNKR